MSCVAPSAQSWRDQMDRGDDAYVAKELERAWNWNGKYLPFHKDKRESTHHDWTNFRQATLREARRRGLDISVTGLGT